MTQRVITSDDSTDKENRSRGTRRYYLAAAGISLIALAGCTSSSTEDVEGGTRDNESTNESNTESSNESNTADAEDTEGDDDENEGTPALEIIEHELVVEEGEFSTDVYVEALIENSGDAPSGNIELQADWYNADGNYLDNSRNWLVSLGAGESWEARIYHLGSNSETVDDYELEGEFTEEPAAINPAGLELLDSEMQVGENEVVVTGEIENTSGEIQNYVAATAKIYDEDGLVLGDNFTNVSDLRAGETWAFEVSWHGRDRVDRAASHEVLTADTV